VALVPDGGEEAMSTWEERMSARAKAKGWAGAKYGEDSKHAGHETHTEGNSVVCSCGEFMGIFSVALTDEGFDEDEDMRPASS